MVEIGEVEFNNILGSMSHSDRMDQRKEKDGYVTKITYANTILRVFDARNPGGKMDIYYKLKES